MIDLLNGTVKEQEMRLDYLLRQRREVIAASKKDPRWGFDDPRRLFFKKMHYLNPQSYGSRIANYYNEKVGLQSVSKDEERGDSKNKLDAYFEGKASYKTTEGEYNFIQIRPWHDVHGYYFIAIDPDKNYEVIYFYLTKDEAKVETYHIGNLAHGVRKSADKNEHKEYKIQLKEGTVDFARWIRRYRVPDFKTFKQILTKKPFTNEKRAEYGRKYHQEYLAARKRKNAFKTFKK